MNYYSSTENKSSCWDATLCSYSSVDLWDCIGNMQELLICHLLTCSCRLTNRKRKSVCQVCCTWYGVPIYLYQLTQFHVVCFVEDLKSSPASAVMTKQNVKELRFPLLTSIVSPCTFPSMLLPHTFVATFTIVELSPSKPTTKIDRWSVPHTQRGEGTNGADWTEMAPHCGVKWCKEQITVFTTAGL